MSHLDRQHMTNGKGKIIGEEEKEEEQTGEQIFFSDLDHAIKSSLKM